MAKKKNRKKTKKTRSTNSEEISLTKGEIFLELVKSIISLVGKATPWCVSYLIVKKLAGRVTVVNSDFLGKFADIDFESLFKNLYTYIIVFLLFIIILLVLRVIYLKNENKKIKKNFKELKDIIGEKNIKKGVKK